MDLVWYDYVLVAIGLPIAFFFAYKEVWWLFLISSLLWMIGAGDAGHRTKDERHRMANQVRTALHEVGFVSPTAVHQHSVQWTENGCQFTFQFKQLDGGGIRLVTTHQNGTTTILKADQLDKLLSNPVCQ